MAKAEVLDELVYLFITNIPKPYHTSDLRNFFSQFIETQGFDCFHFRHRPAIRKIQQGTNSSIPIGEPQQTSSTLASTPGHLKNENTFEPTCCCLVRLRQSKVEGLFRRYHMKHWIDTDGQTLNQRCFISRIKFKDDVQSLSENTFVGRHRKMGSKTIPIDRVAFAMTDIQDLAELKPPNIMPQGNVGTPTYVFLELIQTCRMPSRLIGKLGLVFPKTRGRRQYSSVPFQYRGTNTIHTSDHGSDTEEEMQDVQTARGHKLSDTVPLALPVEIGVRRIAEDVSDNESIPENNGDDDNSVEEWDRHEAFYDDVTEQDRTKERRFEKEIELQWEKGGSGLVYYTDAQFWDEQKGDFDERTADDWDVDVSGYYDKDGGDMDARDYIQIRKDDRRRSGTEVESAFESKIGTFEKHTKGIGRKLLEKEGWSDGQGLGKTVQGIADALGNEGKHPRDKRGLGFYGEKRIRFGIKRKVVKEVNIATIYDDPLEVDKPERLLRRNSPTFIQRYTTQFHESSNE